MDEVELGRGQSHGIDWELIYCPAHFGYGPEVIARIPGAGSGGRPLPDRLDTPLPAPSVGDGFPNVRRGTLLVHGELGSGFNRLSITSDEGMQEEATIVDCFLRFGFNYFVGVLLSTPNLIEASSACGLSESRIWP
jgi:hypothetical protein